MTAQQLKEIATFIASFLVDMTGNEIFEKWTEKRKITKILNKDSKNIKRIFYITENLDLYNLIEEFIMISAFKNVEFYSLIDLTPRQENELWEKFSDYISREMKDAYVDIAYKDKIVKCINLHNKEINDIILDNKDRLHGKVMQRQYESLKNSLSDIVDILNTETKLQERNIEIDFFLEQLESIMKSYRYDINQLRQNQRICILGTIIIVVLMSSFIPLSQRYVDSSVFYITIDLLLVISVLLLFVYWIKTQVDLKKYEYKMNCCRNTMWEIHRHCYLYQLEKVDLYDNFQTHIN